ncbi:hypothetical protein PN498_11435 [Oscillatoria sp. CS-180]|uniref:hypothetical protein n=1 Tax=Oscillatoria sp. CS-180 TaxID=3021720 RepID=UPI00232CC830|nr:hypothetical protein [Oscillatoria sp. CS-180]MDB9526605.1 hypothetical protein [Oscillatoria sp. CS-180]
MIIHLIPQSNRAVRHREQHRHLKRRRYRKYGDWLIAIDRTQWKGQNIFMITLVWGTHAMPLY